jgi:membrane protein implicated in regulation of membrane protease activity
MVERYRFAICAPHLETCRLTFASSSRKLRCPDRSAPIPCWFVASGARSPSATEQRRGEVENEMDPEVFRWVWLFSGVALLVAEMSTASLFALPFAIGAFGAAAVAFAGFGAPVQLAVCAIVSAASYAGLRPLAKRMNSEGITSGVGSRRLVDESGVVLAEIPAGDVGMVRVDTEEWRAESFDGQRIERGARVRVVDTRGTRVIVAPFEAPVPDDHQLP